MIVLTREFVIRIWAPISGNDIRRWLVRNFRRFFIPQSGRGFSFKACNVLFLFYAEYELLYVGNTINIMRNYSVDDFKCGRNAFERFASTILEMKGFHLTIWLYSAPYPMVWLIESRVLCSFKVFFKWWQKFLRHDSPSRSIKAWPLNSVYCFISIQWSVNHLYEPVQFWMTKRQKIISRRRRRRTTHRSVNAAMFCVPSLRLRSD